VGALSGMTGHNGGVSEHRLPDWLRPVADRAGGLTMEALTRVPTPPADARPAAVLMLFADGRRGPEILLTRRGADLRHHAGQISFPGGGADPGDTGPADTALREANEEVGLDPATVDVFGELPTLWLPPSNFAVTPVLGYWTEPAELASTSEIEVVEVLHQPIAELVDPAHRFSVTHPSGWIGPAFDVGLDVPLWGFTAGLVARLFEAVGWERPWDASDHRELPAAAWQ